MRPAVARLALCSLLFVLWLGYLYYLVAMGKPIVLSRPQFLVSQFDIIATIVDRDKVQIDEVLSPLDDALNLRSKEPIKVVNLESCVVAVPQGSLPEGKKEPAFTESLKGESFLLPLRRIENDVYEVAPTSNQSRGYPPRIYPATAHVRAEYGQIRKPE